MAAKTRKRASAKSKVSTRHAVSTIGGLHFISDIGCVHVETVDGNWLPIEHLVETFETTPVFHNLRVFSSNRDAVASAFHRDKDSNVYPICGRTLLRLIGVSS